MSYPSKQRGFTLIELLVVVAIIGLLASVVLASLSSARKKGRDARRLADLKQFQVSLELYYSDNSAYPVSTTQAAVTTALTALDPDYIPVLSDDPLGGSYHYVYISDSGGTKYCIGSILETTAPSGVTATCQNSLTLTGVQNALNP